MKVKISYIDTDSLAPEDIIANAKAIYGSSAVVEVAPDDNDPYAHLYFAVQKLITHNQVDSFFDDGVLYPEKLNRLEDNVRELLEEALERVVSDNEEKISD